MTKQTYASPAAFKQALEQRLRAASGSGLDLARRRQLLVFDRFLARIVHTLGDAAMLKGGLVLELRLSRARTTKDIEAEVYRIGILPATLHARLPAWPAPARAARHGASRPGYSSVSRSTGCSGSESKT